MKISENIFTKEEMIDVLELHTKLCEYQNRLMYAFVYHRDEECLELLKEIEEYYLSSNFCEL